ncbi:MAG TPA: hypothetical protein VJX29_06380 [Candidatus Acidoferrales bacterium]|nr:hypothetical protein [Candidatus Acidoferrales bacterium]
MSAKISAPLAGESTKTNGSAATTGATTRTDGSATVRATEKTETPPQRWVEAQLVFPLYRAMAEQFNLSGPPCTLEDLCGPNRREDLLQAVRAWFDQMDQATPVHQVRQLLQANYAAAEKNLRAFALRLLRKPAKQASDRNKVDFVIVQYFAACAPQHVATRDVSYADTALVLGPILGHVSPQTPEALKPLENILHGARQCGSLAELLHSKMLEQGRQIKDSLGEGFYHPDSLVAFCRFNYLLRRAFIRLSHADLRVTRDALCQLEGCGIDRIDCRAAGLSAGEPVAELHRICSDWKHPFRAEFNEYSIPTMLERLIALRAAAEAALAAVAAKAAPETEVKPAKVPEFAIAPEIEEKPAQEKEHDLFAGFNAGPRAAQPKAPQRGAASPRPAFRSVLALAEPPAKAPAGRPAATAEVRPKTDGKTFRVAEAGVEQPKLPLKPLAPLVSAPEPGAKAAETAAAQANSAGIKEITEAEVENCSEKVWEQLIAAPRDRGRSMSTINIEGVRLLLSSWEVASFVSDGGTTAKDIRRAVVVRALLAAALDIHVTRGDRGRLAAALTLAANEMNRMQGAVERAKSAKQTEDAVNLSMTAKRLLAFVEQAGDLRV